MSMGGLGGDRDRGDDRGRGDGGIQAGERSEIMKERSVIFSADSVRAILEGRKTQTRRVVRLRDFKPCTNVRGSNWYFRARNGIWSDVSTVRLLEKYCPYGQPGDRLWVKEAYSWVTLIDPDPWDGEFGLIKYIPNDYKHAHAGCRVGMLYRATNTDWEGVAPWVSPIYMPRWASRITLEIVSVRVERVQEIGRTDAAAEGVSNMWQWDAKRNAHHPEHFARGVLNPYIANYRVAWDKLNAKRGFGWDVNPWVWVIEFRRLDDGR